MAEESLRTEVELVFTAEELIDQMTTEIVRHAEFWLSREASEKARTKHKNNFRWQLRDYLKKRLKVRPILKDQPPM